MEGWVGRKVGTTTEVGKPLQVKSPRALRHEKLVKGIERNQSVKDVQNVEGAAQPGEVTPV
jgi:hypothetical protein